MWQYPALKKFNFCVEKMTIYFYSKVKFIFCLLILCNTEFLINNILNYVTVAPDITVIGQEDVWYVGQKNVQLDCRASANPPALLYLWTRSVLSSTLHYNLIRPFNSMVKSRDGCR